MSTNSETKINKLLQKIPTGTIILSGWLKKQGYSHELQHRYLKSEWFVSVGYGAFKRKGDEVNLNGALYALQKQAGKAIHIGGRSALALQGYAHYLELYQKETLLFAQNRVKLPSWLRNSPWDTKPVLIHSSILPPGYCLTDYQDKFFTIKISDPVRALLECLQLTPGKFDLKEAFHIMDGLTTLRPEIVQETLQMCKSVKVTRLFLFLAEKSNHTWFKYLNLNHINMGKGTRSITSSGVYNSKYKIIVPENII